MTMTIALAGKGGVGKTTIAAMLIKYLIDRQTGSILAIDADPSSNLNMVLGLDMEWTVGEIRENLLSQVKQSLTAGGAAMGALPGGMNKRDFLDYEIRASLAESNRVDLIAMGQSEGPGCYCAVNHNLRAVIDDMSKNYRYVVIDNEAGMEHLSRRTTRDVKHLLVVTDPSMRGMAAAERINTLRHELAINVEQAHLIINRLPGPNIPAPIQERIDALDMPLLGIVPYNEQIIEYDIYGTPLVEMDDDSPVFQSVAAMLAPLF